jgi:DNA-binding CsgD family transcriptional regulator
MLKFINKSTFLIVVFCMVALASGADLLADLLHGASTQHIVKEASIIFLSVLAIAWMIVELNQRAKKIHDLKAELEIAAQSRFSAQDYVIEGRKQLRQVVEKQFAEWQLTSSETEVGWLLLKGLSLKEIAVIRDTLEKTVRQQASSIYRKSGVPGRHAFSAWFIEDIL